MNINISTPLDWTPLDWFGLLSLVFIILMAFYEAWVNLIYGKVSKYSIDALLVFLILKFGNEKARKRARAFTKDTNRILLFGVYALLTFFGGIYAIIVWLQRIAK